MPEDFISRRLREAREAREAREVEAAARAKRKLRSGEGRIRVTEDDPRRSWRPEEKVTDEAMNVVLGYLIEKGRSYQADIAEHVAAELGIKLGTAAAYTSASLLYFREAGWVRHVEDEGHKAIWEAVA